jgi:hypothetical protein
MPRLYGQNMIFNASNLFGSSYAFRNWFARPRVFAKLPRSTNLAAMIEVHPKFFKANISAYCTDRILLIAKGKGPNSNYCDEYCIFGEIEGLDPVPIRPSDSRNRPLTS